jgi:hypothetical protein
MMTAVKKEEGIIHLYIKETLRVEHQKKRGRPREDIPDFNSIPLKVRNGLDNGDFRVQWDSISELVRFCGSFRKTEKWLEKYKPSVFVSRKSMSEVLNTYPIIEKTVRKRVKKFLEQAKKKNGLLTKEELMKSFEITITEFIREKINMSRPLTHPLGTKSTDNKRLNLRAWKLKKESEKKEELV